MIIRSVFVCIALLIIYGSIIYVHPVSEQVSQHQWQENLIKAQQYIYNKDKSKLKIILGSSLSCRILMDSLPQEYYNFSLQGKSLFDGLEIISKLSEKPAEIFVEMNMVKRPADPSFTNGLLMPVVSVVKGAIPLLQEKNQPVTFAAIILNPVVRKYFIDPVTYKLWNPVISRLASKEEHSPDAKKDFYQFLVARQVKGFSTAFKAEEMKEKFYNLKKNIAALYSKGVKITFFEMPMHPETEYTVQMKSVRQLFQIYFPADEYKYIPKPLYSDYTTTDGIHLDEASAIKFTKYFLGIAKLN